MQDETAIELVRQTARFIRNARAVSLEATRAGALNVPLSLVLDSLVRHGDCRAADIGDAIGITPSVLSRHIAELEEQDLIERGPDPEDARARIVSVTDLGRQRLHESQHQRAARMIEKLGDWDEQAAIETVHALNHLSTRIEHSGTG